MVLWLALAPTSLGGSSTYVTTYGVSMEPTLHRGDLAVVREQPTYRVGDVVAYRSASLHTVVLHRIIGRDGDRYVFKGDNNTWVDNDHPSDADLVGRMEMRLPGVGEHMQQVASPPAVGAIAGMGALPFVAKRKRARSRSREGARAPRPPRQRRVTSRAGTMWRHVDPKLLTATAVAVAVAAFAFTRPLDIHTTRDLPFDDRGEFTYAAEAPGGDAVYPGGRVESGQPIFLNLVDRVAFTFTYRADAAVPLVAVGDVALRGSVSDSDGWSLPFDVAPTTPFNGSDVTVGGTVDLTALRGKIAGVEQATGVKHDSYTVQIAASVNREIHRNDAVVTGPFAATLSFTLDALEMHLAAPSGDALTPSKGGLLGVPTERENHIELLGQSPSVAGARAVAIALALVLGALWCDWMWRTSRSDERSLIQRRYRTYLLPVRAPELTSGIVIDVETMAGLARIADHAGAPVLQSDGGVYGVVDGDRLYRYRALTLETSCAAPTPEPRIVERSPRRDRPLRAQRTSE